MASGRLYVVATPIGNLGDLSPRAREVLASVDLIAAEDTRVTGRLLSLVAATGTDTRRPRDDSAERRPRDDSAERRPRDDSAERRPRMLSYREENERHLSIEIVARLEAGDDVALVSDAGTPTISDPGYRLVRAAADAGIEVVSVPGPSALVALLSISGLPTDRFRFEGFLPAKQAARRKVLESLRGAGTTVVFYEAPHRVAELLADVAELLGDPPVAAGRELTKMHEEVRRGSASEVAAGFETKEPRGEFVVAVAVAADDDALAGEALEREVQALAAEGLSAREIAARLKPRGAQRRKIYEILRQSVSSVAGD
jgi:16S rRNA (cytidine1402-2'-O)-methyltransferase